VLVCIIDNYVDGDCVDNDCVDDIVLMYWCVDVFVSIC